VLLLVVAITLAFTYTRTAWIAALVGLFVVGFLDNRIFAIGLVLIALSVPFLIPSITERFDDLDEATTASGQVGNSLAWRIDTWRTSLGEIENPVSGLGLRTADTLTEDGKLPHNDLVRMYVELGLLGLFAYLWLLQRLFVTASRGLRVAHEGLSRGVAVGFFGALIAFVVVSLVSNVMSQLVLWWYFGTMAVLAAAVPKWEAARTAPKT
jgi:O-antigen ligase